jgi:hypothetical protein
MKRMRHSTWTKESALEELDRLISVIADLCRVRAMSAEHIRWHQSVVSLLEEVFGQDSRTFVNFSSLAWKRTGSFIVGGLRDPAGSIDPQSAVDREHHKAYLEQLETARGLLLAAKDDLERKGLVGVYQGKCDLEGDQLG